MKNLNKNMIALAMILGFANISASEFRASGTPNTLINSSGLTNKNNTALWYQASETAILVDNDSSNITYYTNVTTSDKSKNSNYEIIGYQKGKSTVAATKNSTENKSPLSPLYGKQAGIYRTQKVQDNVRYDQPDGQYINNKKEPYYAYRTQA